MLTYILFIVGFVFLAKGADFLVNGASGLARRFGVSDLTVGLTVVAFGTSALELVVNLYASVEGLTDIAIGNILGSNIANVLLILGISSIIRKIVVTDDVVWKQIPLGFLAIVVLGVLVNDVHIESATDSSLGRIDGLVLLSFFVIFLYYIFGVAKKNEVQPESKQMIAK